MHTLSRRARIGRLVGLFLCLALLAGCGGSGPEGNEYVDYDGTTLVVEGTPYPREATLDPPGTYLAGRIVVQPEQGKHDAATALIERYGLTLEGRSAEGWLLVKGPDGFEMQWASAIQHQLGGLSFATNDAAGAPTPIAVVADAAPASGASVPDREPSAEEVRRAFFDLYEKLDVAGGLPVTITASGQSTVLRAKLFDARKESCRTLPHAKPGEWECEAELMMSLCSGDCDPADEEPSPKGERISLRWAPEAERYTLND
ncbi:hypothetical protein [Pseudoxanthomonas sp. Root630]|uniref:hypothetical protein n=1 Tax=Pseudoxanthomonas sp. Root630 TaxID=1736574 RepID=UPI000A953491|nr:hypothetical protein [Pseudoxanthomonas sp. Root630]